MKKFLTASLVAALSLTMLTSGALAFGSKQETTSVENSSNASAITFNWQKPLGWEADLTRYDSNGVRFYWGSGSGAVTVTVNGYATSRHIGDTSIYALSILAAMFQAYLTLESLPHIKTFTNYLGQICSVPVFLNRDKSSILLISIFFILTNNSQALLSFIHSKVVIVPEIPVSLFVHSK
ncbi:hypothetical protein [Paenibacillus elgii]|uniref:hypothetical protein n=1 Tax=Paenibacillus elgii TaxID=189691 RepID=UPI0020413591|nr:hypothetical protein [Paenibacillus elgii]MCM3273974.1 hypothetical protein [Paenibacillus elgii]